MFLCSLIKELRTKEENDKTGCNFNFEHECILIMLDETGAMASKLTEFRAGDRRARVVHHPGNTRWHTG